MWNLPLVFGNCSAGKPRISFVTGNAEGFVRATYALQVLASQLQPAAREHAEEDDGLSAWRSNNQIVAADLVEFVSFVSLPERKRPVVRDELLPFQPCDRRACRAPNWGLDHSRSAAMEQRTSEKAKDRFADRFSTGGR